MRRESDKILTGCWIVIITGIGAFIYWKRKKKI